MMAKYKTYLYLFSISVIVCCTTTQKGEDNYADLVDPLIGTAPANTKNALKHSQSNNEKNAQVIPAVTMPFGMTNWTPQTRNSEQKCVAPYYYSDSVLTGIRGSHWISGSCTQDYGSFYIMPITGKLNCNTESIGSPFTHKNEISTPYYYKARFDAYQVTAEVTATTRCGYLRFSFETGNEAHFIISPLSDEAEGYIQIIPENNEIIGYNPAHRIYQGWGESAGFAGYFVIRFKKQFKNYGTFQDRITYHGSTTIEKKKNIGAFVSFDVTEKEQVEVIAGTSFTSLENARNNLNREIGADKTFQDTYTRLKNDWNTILSRIKISDENHDSKTMFYTALYHCYQQPRTFNDIDGSYPGFGEDVNIYRTENDENYYADFSVWDTYRALHPLFNLILPDYNQQMLNSLMLKAEQGGWLPIFPCWDNYTSAMIGDHVISLFADAYEKDIITLNDSDYSYLYQNAMKTPSDYNDYLKGKGRRALNSYLKYGYIPLEDSVKESFHVSEQVSRTLEYAYDDFAMAQIAKKMGKMNDYSMFIKRSENFRNVFDTSVQCVNGKYIDGSFTTDFDKYERKPYITEGTPWQYTWYVPHNIAALQELMGGKQAFNNNLETFFRENQYWHGNEPGQQIPFLFAMSGKPAKTQEVVNDILLNEYGTGPGGLSGNDDAGQMSAWYIFASLGFYPVCPGTNQYVISGPHVKKATIFLTNGKSFTILAHKLGPENTYIQAIKLNGKPYTQNYIDYKDILNGGILEFSMSQTPIKQN